MEKIDIKKQKKQKKQLIINEIMTNVVTIGIFAMFTIMIIASIYSYG